MPLKEWILCVCATWQVKEAVPERPAREGLEVRVEGVKEMDTEMKDCIGSICHNWNFGCFGKKGLKVLDMLGNTSKLNLQAWQADRICPWFGKTSPWSSKAEKQMEGN